MTAAATMLDGGAIALLDLAVGPENTIAVMDMILETAPGLGRQMRAAAAAGDFGGVRNAAHQLKSNCNHLGATDLAASLQQIESRAQAGAPELPPVDLAVASVLLERFLDAVRNFRDARLREAQP